MHLSEGYLLYGCVFVVKDSRTEERVAFGKGVRKDMWSHQVSSHIVVKFASVLKAPRRALVCHSMSIAIFLEFNGSPLAETMERFEQGVMKLIEALEKVDATNKCGNVGSPATNHVETEKRKTRASKVEHELVDEVYVLAPGLCFC